MKIAVASADANFLAAVTGFAGAMGHEMAGDPHEASLTVIDGALDEPSLAAALGAADGVRTVVFVPREDRTTAALVDARGVMHVHPRRSLPVELPRLIGLDDEG